MSLAINYYQNKYSYHSGYNFLVNEIVNVTISEFDDDDDDNDIGSNNYNNENNNDILHDNDNENYDIDHDYSENTIVQKALRITLSTSTICQHLQV